MRTLNRRVWGAMPVRVVVEKLPSVGTGVSPATVGVMAREDVHWRVRHRLREEGSQETPRGDRMSHKKHILGHSDGQIVFPSCIWSSPTVPVNTAEP